MHIKYPHYIDLRFQDEHLCKKLPNNQSNQI